MPKKEIVILEPRYTQFPNVIIDNAGDMSEAELRIALVVVRKTFGWHKGSDRISLSQFESLSKMSHNGCISGIRQALDDKIIRRRKKGDSFVYTIRISKEDSYPASAHGALPPSAPNALPASARGALPPSARGAHTKENDVKHTAALGKRKHHHQPRQTSFFSNDDDGENGTGKKAAALLSAHAQRMNAHFGIDMPVALQLAKLEWVNSEYLDTWEKYDSDKNKHAVAELDLEPAERKTKTVGPGFFVTMIRDGKTPIGDRARSRSKRGGARKVKKGQKPLVKNGGKLSESDEKEAT